jgi:hypothetical protein
MIYLILGMHKSGTTLLSTILHKSGINMGESFDVGTYDTGNQFERDEMLAINMHMLGVSDDQTLKLKPEVTDSRAEEGRQKIKSLIRECEKKYKENDWGMKDPRTALTYNFWDEQLPEHKLIGIFRAPEQVWPRYRWKGWRRRYVNLWWAWNFLNRWAEHNLGLIDAVKNSGHDYFVINYLNFMTDKDEIKRLSKFVDRPLSDERKLSMYRSKKGYDLPLLVAKWLVLIFKGRSIDKIIADLECLSDRGSEVSCVK